MGVVPSRFATASAARRDSVSPRFRADCNDDVGRGRTESTKVVLARVASHDVLPDEWIVSGTVILGSVTRNRRGLAMPVGEVVWDRAYVKTRAKNFAIAGPKPSRRYVS